MRNHANQMRRFARAPCANRGLAPRPYAMTHTNIRAPGNSRPKSMAGRPMASCASLDAGHV
jgi:hypothetical protein